MFWVREYSYHFHFLQSILCRVHPKANTTSRTTHQKQPPLMQPLYITPSISHPLYHKLFQCSFPIPTAYLPLHTFINTKVISENSQPSTPPHTVETPTDNIPNNTTTIVTHTQNISSLHDVYSNLQCKLTKSLFGRIRKLYTPGVLIIIITLFL